MDGEQDVKPSSLRGCSKRLLKKTSASFFVRKLPDTVTLRNLIALVNYGIARKKEWAVLQKRLLSPKLTQMEIARQLGLNQPEVNKILNSPFVIEVLPKPIWADDDDDEF